MSDVNLALTAAGQALKAKIEAGDGNIPLKITRIVAASGRSDDPLNLTALVDEKQQFTITNKVTMGARTAISAFLSNMGNAATEEDPLDTGYPMTQVGFYAEDPDDGEILYRVSQYDAPNYVPAAKERGWSYEPTYNFVTGNASEVTVVIDPSGLVTMARFQEAITELQSELDDVGGNTIELPDVGPVNTKLHFRLLSTGKKWRETWSTDPEDNWPEDEPVPGLLMAEDGSVVKGSIQLEDGTVAELSIIPESSGE